MGVSALYFALPLWAPIVWIAEQPDDELLEVFGLTMRVASRDPRMPNA